MVWCSWTELMKLNEAQRDCYFAVSDCDVRVLAHRFVSYV